MGRMTQEALILAGGLGTRLRAAVADRPKPMAGVDGRPFILFLLEQLARHGFQHAVICLGHLGELVPPSLGDRFGPLHLDYSFEPVPLGTAGALRNAAALLREDHVLAMNGDSFCDVDLRQLERAHHDFGAAATLVVLPQDDRRRAGGVRLGAGGRIVAFESRPAVAGPGLINAGIYVLRREVLDIIPGGRAVSLEEEIFPLLVERRELFGWQAKGRFIDIGTPDSYAAAQTFFLTDKG
jgi:D-glycero-alpha-D-manno-heptose 1-phosphate guanylyltransferase